MTKDKEAKLTTLLQGAGIRPTRQRLALAAILFDGTHKHMSAEQVHAATRKQRCEVALATVYNSLHQFSAAGLLREVMVDQSQLYFDTNIGAHYHFFDEVSGHLHDIPADAVAIGNLPPPPKGRSISQVDLIIRIGRDK